MSELFDLFKTFCRIGGLTFGGGYAMLPMLEKEVVENRKWVTSEELLDYYAVGQTTPGIIAVNTATFIGYKVKGIMGALFATIGVVFPSLVIIMIIATSLQSFSKYEVVQNAFSGIRVVVAVLILNAIIKLWKSSVIDKVSIELIFNTISSNRILRAQRQFNLRWALLDYLEGSKRRENMVMDVRSQLREHMASKEEWTFSSEEEFSYALGQVVSFLISRSKANKIPSSWVNPFLNAKNHDIAQERLLQLYKKYNYDISHKSLGRAERLFGQIMAYVPEKGAKLNCKWIGAGYASPSLLYEKKNTEQEINADAQEDKQ